MIRKALESDLRDILEIVKNVVAEMKECSNDQWNEVYPARDDFVVDIASGELWVDSDPFGGIRSFVCLNTSEPQEYAAVPWLVDQRALIVHRLAVNPDYRGRGLAKKILLFAEEQAKTMKLQCLRSDTCTQNNPMNGLFIRMNYTSPGIISFPHSAYDFNCYEKSLA